MPIVINPSTPNPSGPSTATSSDSHLTVYVDATYCGVLLKADFSGLGTKPIKVRFMRGSDRVRSGDPAWAPGGIGFAYDHEAPLSTSTAWTAVPIFADGSEGSASTAATVTTAGIPAGYDFVVKPTSDPGSMTLLKSLLPEPTRGRVGMLNLTDIPGSRFKSGTWEPRQYADDQFSFQTATLSDYVDLETCMDAGIVFIQCTPAYGIDDFYAIPSDSSVTAMVYQADPRRQVQVTFVHQPRPPTLGSPSMMPGRSWQTVKNGYATYSAVTAAYATNEALLH